MSKLKVALIHDWLTGMRGGEKVLEAFCELFQEADIYTFIWNKGRVSEKIERHKIYTSILQKLPFSKTKYRYYLPIMPYLIESFYLKNYELVISSSHCVAKGIKVKKGIPHICYCHTPMRYVWDLYDDYFGKGKTNFFVRTAMRFLRGYLQKWDIKSSFRVTHFIANSKNVKRRIEKYYGRDAVVIYPPVDISAFPEKRKKDFYLVVTAFVPYKKVEIVIDAFNRLKYPLKIVGTGPEERKLRKMAEKNIEFLGWIDNFKLKEYYAEAKAFIFPQLEDFGITAVESLAAGTPVIAYNKGGVTEIIQDGETGVFFDKQTPESLISAIKRFEKMSFDREILKKKAYYYRKERFINEIKNFIETEIKF
ncbi:MAG: glycosyltransferase family 4 protein [Caldiserica bacterium]|nr:MAG: glycosyltransferase family 4 protein [Caldisericota bacterium]